MAGTLLWRARDVCRVCMVLVLWITGISVYAQSVATRKVNCAFNATRLDDVIRHLSLEAGVSFIYSSNKTDLSKLVTLHVENRSLDETLTMIGQQLGVEFKMQGLYVMIKQQADTRTSRQNGSGKVPVARLGKVPSHSNALTYYPASHNFSENRLAVPVFTERVIPVFEPTATAAQVSTIPLVEARKVSADKLHGGWFVSVGTVLNDYSSGFELQAGARRAYFVYTPTWMSSGRYHGGYGVGTSIDLGRNLAFTPVYILGSSQHTTTTSWRNNQGLNELKSKEKTIHHQVKLMVQYAVTPSFVVRLGPTINQSNTNYDTYYTTTFTQRRSVVPPTIHGDAYGNVIVVNQVDASNKSALYSRQRVRDAWMGWEASIAFKINFSGK